jgi:hypothetical protein
MRPRHAAALALVGWYLMMPPTQEHLDSSCSNHMGILDSLIYSLKMEGDSDRIKRCDREAILLVSDAPFSQWYQADEFETLAECRAEQQQPPTEQEKARMKSLSGLTAGSRVSEDDLIRTQQQALTFSKCLASDDPRLR